MPTCGAGKIFLKTPLSPRPRPPYGTKYQKTAAAAPLSGAFDGGSPSKPAAQLRQETFFVAKLRQHPPLFRGMLFFSGFMQILYPAGPLRENTGYFLVAFKLGGGGTRGNGPGPGGPGDGPPGGFPAPWRTAAFLQQNQKGGHFLQAPGGAAGFPRRMLACDFPCNFSKNTVY